MMTRHLGMLCLLLTSAGVARAEDAAGCKTCTFPAPPITLYNQLPPGPPNHAPTQPIPAVKVYQEAHEPPTWQPPVQKPPVTLFWGVARKVELFFGVPRPVELCTREPELPRWTSAPPLPTVTVFRRVPEMPEAAPTVVRPSVKLFHAFGPNHPECPAPCVIAVQK